MEITDVKVIPVDDEKLKAFVSIVFDQCFVVTDIKIIHGPEGPVRLDAEQEAEGRDLQGHRASAQQPDAAVPRGEGARRCTSSRSGRPRRLGAPRSARRGGERAPPQQGGAPRGRTLASKPRLGRGQVVRRGALDPVFEGSNPSAPATRPDAGATEPMHRELKVFTGSAHPALGESIARYLGVPLGRAHLARFSDGEVWFQIQDNVRGADVFVVQPTCAAGQREPDGAAADARRLQALERLAHHRRDALLRLRAPGPQGQAAGAHLGQAGGRPALDRRHRPRPHHGPARRADPGLLRHPGRPPVRGARHHRLRVAARTCPTSRSSRPTPAASSARAPTPSASTRRSPSSTSGATSRTWPRSTTSSATSRAAPP